MEWNKLDITSIFRGKSKTADQANKIKEGKISWGDLLVHAGLIIVASISFLVLLLVFVFLFYNALPAFVQVGWPFQPQHFQPISLTDFLFGTTWNPTSMIQPAYGVLPLLAGTFLVSIVATFIAIPIGVGCTIYIAEIAHPRVRGVLKPIIEILAGIPSVVYGLFAMMILSQWLKDIFHLNSGWNALNGAIMLAVMMIPIMVSLSEDAIHSVPKELREASYALGANRWETMRSVILPAALSGIVAAVILSIGRAIGETMVVLMATGNSALLTFNLFSPVEPMTAAIAIDMGEVAQNSLHYDVLFAVGVLLFVITLIINTIADRIMARYSEAYQ
jgi:phosphate transport system permease protein